MTTLDNYDFNSRSNAIFEDGIIHSFQDFFEQVGEHSIHYKLREGKEHPERTFILSHGAFGTEGWLRVVAANLSKIFPEDRIIIVDLPWHGQSTGVEGELEIATVHTYAKVMKQFIHQKQANQTIEGILHWIGWSMGGSVGMLLDLDGVDIQELTLLNSSAYWGSVTHLVQVSPIMSDEKTSQAGFRDALIANLETNVTKEEKETIIAYYEQMAATGKVGSHDLAFAISTDNFDIRSELPKIKAKTLILGGDSDTLSLMEYLQVMNEGIPDSKLKVYEQDNHYMLVKPEQAKRIVEDIAERFDQ